MTKSLLSLLLSLYAGLLPTLSKADSSPLDNLTLRLVKSPDVQDSTKPALLGIQRNDGGNSNYITEGALKVDHDFGENNAATFSPSVSWNRNTLTSTPTDTWSYGLGIKYRWLLNPELDSLVFSANLSQQRDLTKNSNALVAKASTTWYGFPEWKKSGALDYATIRPTVTLFSKHVYDAKTDATTGISPTGTINGAMIFLDAEADFGRWSLGATTQILQTSQVVAGDVKGNHHLSKISISYQLTDSPPSNGQQKSPQWIPSIVLSRQVGDDPLNAISRAGFTVLSLSLQY